jgi:hypothetical protein
MYKIAKQSFLQAHHKPKGGYCGRFSDQAQSWRAKMANAGDKMTFTFEELPPEPIVVIGACGRLIDRLELFLHA